MADLHIVVLAAGMGTRVKSALPKVLHRVAGAPMIAHVLAGAQALRPRSVTVVVGHQADAVKSVLSGHPGLTYVVQEPQLGTGHALLTAAPALNGSTGTVILLSGDVPLLTATTLRGLLDRHQSTDAGWKWPPTSGVAKLRMRATWMMSCARSIRPRASPQADPMQIDPPQWMCGPHGRGREVTMTDGGLNG